MAHNINFSNNRFSFASKKEIAWHGLGQVVDAMTSKEAIELGGLNFEVNKRPLFVATQEITKDNLGKNKLVLRNSEINKDPEFYSVNMLNDKFATVRADTNIPLGIVGSQYEVIQNSEAFDFIDSIIGKNVSYETVGALGNGETVFITVKVQDEWVVNKDLIDRYLLLTMSHDGTSAIQIMYTPIRVVCNNTLTLAKLGNKDKVSIRHTSNARQKLEYAKQALGLIDIKTRTYEEAFGKLAKITVRDNEARDIFIDSLNLKVDEQTKQLSSKGENILQAVTAYYQEGLGQREIVGTGWGVYNAISGYLQNVKDYSSTDTKFKNQFLSGDINKRQNTYEQILTLN
jgi:phage/plasmid-like protein (TIGR03299 family)